MSFFKWLHTVVDSNIHKSGIYDRGGHNILISVIEQESSIIDLGANKGGFYSCMSEDFNCTGYAIEAAPQLFNLLPVCHGIRTYNYAIGKENGFVELFLSNESEANSLHQAIASNWGVTGSVTVPSITLEKFINDQKLRLPVDLLKIDIEGAETDVINTMPDQILSQIKQIPVEFHDFLIHNREYKIAMQEAIKKLRRNNFMIIRFSPYDYRAILAINKNLIRLTFIQKLRLKLIHPFLRNMIFSHTRIWRLLNAHK